MKTRGAHVAALLCLAGLTLGLTACASNPGDAKLDALLGAIDYRSAGHVDSYTAVSNIDSVSRRVVYSSAAAYPVLTHRFQAAGYTCAEDRPAPGEQLASCDSAATYITVHFKATTASGRTSLTISLP